MKIVTIIGARPQFIKAAPVNRAIEGHNRQGGNPQVAEILVHTGQHYDYNMSQIFFDQLKIRKPHYHLGVGSGNHGEMTGMMLTRIEEVLLKESPDRVLVYGDTNSTLAGALAAVKVHIPVAHVEAGLRSFNRRMPEEINRVITDHISSLLFCPTKTAVRNLKNEGVTEGVYLVGDVMYDAFLFNKETSCNKSKALSELELEPGSYCLGTVHRQENTEDPQRLLNIFTAFKELSSADCPFIILLHPRTRKALQQHKRGDFLNHQHVRLIPPASYLDMIALEAHAKVILTDSGGVQKEAYYAEIPCVTLRDETEWIETEEAGWNHLGGADINKIISAFQKAINSLPKKKLKLFGDGNASRLVLQNLISFSSGGVI
jgi:UDP-GlcNAc3NAcA epimerase